MAGTKSGLRRGRILYSILALLFAVGVVPLVWTSYRLYNTGRLSIESNQKEWQLDKARLISTQVTIYVDGLRTQVAAIARTLELDAGSASFAARLARITEQKALDRYLKNSASLVYVTVPDATTATGPWSGLDLRGDARLQEQLAEAFQRGQHRTPMLSVPIVSESLHEPVVVLGEPVLGAGRVECVVLAVASLQPIREITKGTGGGIFEVYVVDNRGRLIAHSDPNRPLAEDLSGIEIVRIFLEQSLQSPAARDATGRRTRSGGFGTTLFEMKDADGTVHEMLGTYVPVPDESGWGVVVQVDIEKAYFTAIDLRNKSILLVAAVTALAVVLGSLLAGGISRPVQKLAESARRLAGGDYASRVAVRSRNEVGVLADAFNLMGEEIQKAIEEIRRRAEENKELFMGSIRMLANAIDEKDPYTRGHSERVAYYSACVAKHLGMGPEEVERVHVSGIIHDVGKIGIEDKILRKPGALTNDEFAVMKTHPSKGADILGSIPQMVPMIPGIKHHHERWSGGGYPEGLRGEQVPLLARIIGVADAFDAMTTHRPYQRAMTFEAAASRINELCPSVYEPTVVEAFNRAVRSGVFKRFQSQVRESKLA